VQVDVAGRRKRGPARVEPVERRLEVLVDRVVLPHGVNLTQICVRGEPRRIVVRDPERH